jgi:hypothetical protein
LDRSSGKCGIEKKAPSDALLKPRVKKLVALLGLDG